MSAAGAAFDGASSPLLAPVHRVIAATLAAVALDLTVNGAAINAERCRNHFFRQIQFEQGF